MGLHEVKPPEKSWEGIRAGSCQIFFLIICQIFFFIFFNSFFQKFYLFLHKFLEVVLYFYDFFTQNFQFFYPFYIIFRNLWEFMNKLAFSYKS